MRNETNEQNIYQRLIMNSNKALGLLRCLMVVGLLSSSSLGVEDFTISNFGDGSQIWFQAEDFDQRFPDNDDVLAVTSPPDGEEAFGEDGFSVINRIGTGGRISYTFDIDQLGLAGTWYFWGRIINPSNRSDWLVVEGDPDDAGFPTEEPFAFAGNVPHHRIFEGNVASFGWFGGEEGHTKELRSGENTMHIFNRESGNGSVFWDVMMWTSDPNYVPTDDDFLASEPFVELELPGDFNGDGAITEADYQIILDNFNLPVDRGLDGDATFDSQVDYRDLVAFRTLFEASNGGAAVQIPEPSAWLMVCIAAVCVGSLRRQTRKLTKRCVATAMLLGATAVGIQLTPSTTMAQEIVIEQLPGTNYLAFEAEDFFSISNGSDETGWIVVDTESPFKSPAPVEPASLILDPATTNAVRNKAVFDLPAGNDQDFVSYRLKFVEDGDYSLYLRYSLFNVRDGAGYGNEDSIYVSSDFGLDGELLDTDADPRGDRDSKPSFYQIFSDVNNEGEFGWWNANADGSDPSAENPDAVFVPELDEELEFGIATREPGVAIDRIIFHTDPELEMTPEVLDSIVSFDPFTFGDDPNDFNQDGSIDLADVDVMRANFGLSFGLDESLEKGDGTRDGFVDLRDFLAVRKIINPPAVGGAGESSSVPEPAGLHVALLSAILGFSVLRRRRG